MTGRYMAGAIGGGLAAGISITAMLIAGERKHRTPSELVMLERAGAAKLGVTPPSATTLPGIAEQAVVQGGHLALSALAGAVYAATVDEQAAVVPSGIAFGLAFYAAMHWIAGPALGVKRPEWTADAPTIGMHALNHVGFGLVTAWAAHAASSA